MNLKMCNLVKRNLNISISIMNKYLMILSICILLNVLYSIITNEYNSLYLNIIGGNNNLHNIISITFLLIVNLYFILSSIYNYNYDFMSSPEFVFLKVDRRKWIISKYLFFLLNSIILNTIITIFFIIICFIFKIKIIISYVILYFLINIFTKFFVEIFSIILFSLFNNLGIIIQITFLIIPLFFKNTILNIQYSSFYTLNNIYILFITFIIFFIGYKINYLTFLKDIGGKNDRIKKNKKKFQK